MIGQDTYYYYVPSGHMIALNRVDATHWYGCVSGVPVTPYPDGSGFGWVNVTLAAYLRYDTVTKKWYFKFGFPVVPRTLQADGTCGYDCSQLTNPDGTWKCYGNFQFPGIGFEQYYPYWIYEAEGTNLYKLRQERPPNATDGAWGFYDNYLKISKNIGNKYYARQPYEYVSEFPPIKARQLPSTLYWLEPGYDYDQPTKKVIALTQTDPGYWLGTKTVLVGNTLTTFKFIFSWTDDPTTWLNAGMVVSYISQYGNDYVSGGFRTGSVDFRRLSQIEPDGTPEGPSLMALGGGTPAQYFLKLDAINLDPVTGARFSVTIPISYVNTCVQWPMGVQGLYRTGPAWRGCAMVNAWGDNDGSGAFNLNGLRNTVFPLFVEMICNNAPSPNDFPMLYLSSPMMTSQQVISGIPTRLKDSSHQGSGPWDCSSYLPNYNCLTTNPPYTTFINQYGGFFTMMPDYPPGQSDYSTMHCDLGNIVNYRFHTTGPTGPTLAPANIFPGGCTAQVLYIPPVPPFNAVVNTSGIGVGPFVEFPSATWATDNWGRNLRNCYPEIITGFGDPGPSFRVTTTLAPQPAVKLFGRAKVEYGRAFVGGGNVTVGGQADVRFRLNYTPVMGTSVRIGGEAQMTDRFGFVMKGGVRIGGLATTEAVIEHWLYTSETGPQHIKVGGSAVVRSNLSYTPPGPPIPYVADIRIGGTCGKVYQGVAVHPTGNSEFGAGVRIGGTAKAGRWFPWVMTGGVTVGGDGSSKSSNLGEFDLAFGGFVFIDSVEFAADPNSIDTLPPLPPDDPDLNQCSCTAAAAMTLTHNIARENPLSDFMGRYGLSMPEPLPLLYSDGIWQANVHFEAGFGPGLETWDIVFDWSCTSEVAAQELGNPIWKLGMLVVRQTRTAEADTRLVLAYTQPTPCPLLRLNLNATFNTQTQNAAPAAVYEVLWDGIGLFKTNYWKSNPLLSFVIK